MYMVIGSGKCGSSLLEAFWEAGTSTIRRISFPIVVNTSSDFFRVRGIGSGSWLGITESGDVIRGDKAAIGSKVIGGMGKKFEQGYAVFAKAKDALAEQLDAMVPVIGGAKQEVNFVLLFYGMGGGTGSGSAPIIAKIFQERNIPVIVVGVLPAFSEGDEKAGNAFSSLRATLGWADGMVLADNMLIDRKEGLERLYPAFNSFIAGCMTDFIFGTMAEGVSVKHSGMGSIDYRDFLGLLNLGKRKAISVLGRATTPAKELLSGKDFSIEELVEKAFAQLSLNVLNTEDVEKIACITTLHSSLIDKFPFHDLEADLKTQTKMQTAHVGYNETRHPLIRVTVSLAFNPNNLTRLWELRERGLRVTQRLAAAGMAVTDELFDLGEQESSTPGEAGAGKPKTGELLE